MSKGAVIFADKDPMPRILNGRAGINFAIFIFLFSLSLLFSLCLNFLFFGRSKDFCRRRLVAPSVRLLLLACGVKIEFDRSHLPSGPVFYLFNHHSNLDIFIIATLNIPKLRTFFSTENKSHRVMMLAAKSIGAFLIPPQHEHFDRVQCFKNVERELKESKESMIASPEGRRFTEGGMASFNKGVFHLAIKLGYPIVPLFFEIPPHANAKSSYEFKPAKIKITALQTVATKGLSETSVIEIKNQVMNIYQAHCSKLRSN